VVIGVLSEIFATLCISGCGGEGGTSLPAPGLSVVRTADLGTVPTNPRILGRDGGYSALFQGKSVWLYGDTFLSPPNATNFTLISDSWSYTSNLNGQSGLTGFSEPLDAAGDPAMILPESTTEAAYNQAHNSNDCKEKPCGDRWALWPSSIVVDPVQNRALIFYMVVSAAPGDFNFHGIGNSVATWSGLSAQPVRPVVSPPVVTGHPDLMFGLSEPNFGSAAFVSGGLLYVYGCGTPSSGTDKGCRLARVDPALAQNRNAWTYYAGDGRWSSKVSDAASVFKGNSILSVSWNNYLQQYVAVYSGFFSQAVLMRTSPTPQGPWSAEVKAFDAKAPASGNVYDAHQHVEFDSNGGQTIYVSYSRSLAAPFTSEVRWVAVTVSKRS